jgi:hypothetical protein
MTERIAFIALVVRQAHHEGNQNPVQTQGPSLTCCP